LLLIALSTGAFSQNITKISFENQEIRDILGSLGKMVNRTVVMDDTVSGRATYFFNEMDFVEAVRVFADAYDLYVQEQDGVLLVSRISVEEKGDQINLYATDVPLRTLVRTLIRSLKQTILYDSLPTELISIQQTAVSLEDILKIIVAKYPNMRLTTEAGYFYLQRVENNQPDNGGLRGPSGIQQIGGLYNLNIERGRFKNLILDLFDKEGREFLFLVDRDVVIENLYLENKPFEEVLRVILLKSNADFVIQDGLYYILEIAQRDRDKKFLDNVILQPNYLAVGEIFKLLPQGLSAGGQIKVDEDRNQLIISGTPGELGPILSFINKLDQPQSGTEYYRFDLQYTKADQALSLISNAFAGFKGVAIPDQNSFLMKLSPVQEEMIQEFLDKIDRRNSPNAISLNYISSEEVTENLPAIFPKENVLQTGNPNMILYTEAGESFRAFKDYLEEIDRPKTQLRYHILVVQYSEDNNFNLNKDLGFAPMNADATQAVLADINTGFTTSFDLLTTFGYQFSLDLETNLVNNSAKVMADTTLKSISGEQVSFQNSATSRYLENKPIDPDTQEPTATGVTKELSSGLFLSLTGSASGNGTIDLQIEATISQELPSTGSGLPTTSEKKITTRVQTPSGAPVSITGLKEYRSTINLEKTPFLGDIPLLGLLFQDRSETLVSTNLVVYIIPFVEPLEKTNASLSFELEQDYRRHMRGF
jgi:general secretion pathway protein D